MHDATSGCSGIKTRAFAATFAGDPTGPRRASRGAEPSAASRVAAPPASSWLSAAVAATEDLIVSCVEITGLLPCRFVAVSMYSSIWRLVASASPGTRIASSSLRLRVSALSEILTPVFRFRALDARPIRPRLREEEEEGLPEPLEVLRRVVGLGSDLDVVVLLRRALLFGRGVGGHEGRVGVGWEGRRNDSLDVGGWRRRFAEWREQRVCCTLATWTGFHGFHTVLANAS